MTASGTAGAPVAQLLTGSRLQAALDVLPAGVAAGVTAVVSSSSATDESLDEFEQITYWQCTGGHITVHTGHIDPVAMMSVYDGSLPTTITCGSS